MLITVARYRTITGDETSASGLVEDAIEQAQSLLEGRLRRPLEQAERTERMRVYADNRMYPKALPIVAVSAGAEVQGPAIVDGTPSGTFLQPDDHAEVTYTGGFDPAEEDMGEVDFVPVELARAVAWAAKAILTPADGVEVPAGATSVSVGDVSISWGPGGSPGTGEVVFSPSLIRRWRWREVA